MESPSSTRRITRSQTIFKKIVINDSPIVGTISKKIVDSQRALVDITNDSPIVGLAKARFLEMTPSSQVSAKRVTKKIKIGTPGSGEALLRAQVITLLEKVEEDAEFSKICHENRALVHLQGFSNSPLSILAPTNTPQMPILSNAQIMELASVTPSLVEDKLVVSKMGNEIIEEKKDLVTRSLLFDFIEKLDGIDSSEVRKDNNDDDDDVSVWSLEVNVSSIRDELEDDEDDGMEKSVKKGDEYEDVLNEVCEGMSKVKIVEEEGKKNGKHTRFVYGSDSDDEFVAVEEEIGLLPKPVGKHIRFDHEEEDCSDEE